MMEANPQMTAYKEILVKVERESYLESFKIAGVPHQPEFGNISDYHNNFKDKIKDPYEPYTEVGIGVAHKDSWDYIFGCRVNSIANLPQGIVGIDTGIKNFAVVTFRSESTFKLVGGMDGPGDGMKDASDYIQNVWLPEHKDEVEFFNLDHNIFMMYNDAFEGGCAAIEVYKNPIDSIPEMCFYIPLKA